MEIFTIMKTCRLKIIYILPLALTACSVFAVSAVGSKNAATTPDPDAIRLIALEEQARQVAQKSQGEILRQVDTDMVTIDFRFVDRAATREVTIVIPTLNTPVEQWKTVVNTVSPLLTYPSPDLDLTALKIGPELVAEAAAGHWKGCDVRTMTLYLENEKLTWLVFCNTTDGVVSGSIDNATGVFQPSDAPPAPVPVTATTVR